MEAFSKYLLLYCLVCLWASAEFEVASSNPLQTEGPETNYVENVSDNEHCFHNDGDDVEKLPCPKGRRRARERGESSCLPCPFEVGGLQTFQPEQNDCDKCILCSECGEGEEVLSNCSRTKDTKCQPIAHQVGSSTTGEISKADVTTLPTEHTTMETIPKNRGTPTGRPGVGMSNIDPNRWESRFWGMTIVACFLFVTLLICISYLLWTHRTCILCMVRRAVTYLHCTCIPCGYAVNSHPSSSGSGGDLDNGKSEGDNEGSPDNPNGVQMNHQNLNVEVHNGDESQNVTPGNTVRVRDQMENGTEEEQETFL